MSLTRDLLHFTHHLVTSASPTSIQPPRQLWAALRKSTWSDQLITEVQTRAVSPPLTLQLPKQAISMNNYSSDDNTNQV